MKEGKRSLFITLSVIFVTLFGFAADLQARPYHGRRSVAHHTRYATAQTECIDLFGNCSNNDTQWDVWQGYERPQQTYRKTRPQQTYRKTRPASYHADSQQSETWSWHRSGVIGTAQSMLGMSEHGNRRTLARTLGVDPARTPWCAAWANAVLRRTGHRTSGSNMARSFYAYGSRSNGEIGDIAVMPHHVGFVAGYLYRKGHKYVGVLGGNTSNRVKTAWYPASRIAFRDPS